jgi:hypothetical protein
MLSGCSSSVLPIAALTRFRRRRCRAERSPERRPARRGARRQGSARRVHGEFEIELGRARSALLGGRLARHRGEAVELDPAHAQVEVRQRRGDGEAPRAGRLPRPRRAAAGRRSGRAKPPAQCAGARAAPRDADPHRPAPPGRAPRPSRRPPNSGSTTRQDRLGPGRGRRPAALRRQFAERQRVQSGRRARSRFTLDAEIDSPIGVRRRAGVAARGRLAGRDGDDGTQNIRGRVEGISS